MTVYVDDAFVPHGRMKMSHMMADTEAELHEMADRIGLKRKWFQGDHYDVSKAKRAEAIEHGAVQVAPSFMVDLRRRRRIAEGSSLVQAERDAALEQERAHAK